MRYYIFSLILTLSTVSFAFSQSDSKLAGDWQGVLKVGVDLRLVFHFKQDATGKFSATADSPDQSAFGLKVDTIFQVSDSVYVTMKAIGAAYAGKLTNDSVITGTFSQRASVPLELKRFIGSIKPTALNRPQTPKAPFPYKTEDVEYNNPANSLRYGATLTIPEGKGPFPTALLITGSGMQDRDETLFGHKPFAVIADALTRNGIAVLRVDDRGAGKSTGVFADATTADFANDVATSLDYLLTRPEVDKKKLGLIGHSEGGMIAPIVVSKRKDIFFTILLAGPGVPIRDLMAGQTMAILGSMGIPSTAVQKYKTVYLQMIDVALNNPDTTKGILEAKKVLNDWAAKTDTVTLTALGMNDADSRNAVADNLVQATSSKWYHYFMNFDPTPYLEKMYGKVLAINGEKDVQVLPDDNLQGIEKALKKSKAKASYTIKKYPGLNHLFQDCKLCTVQEYAKLEQTISPTVLTEINDWLNKNVK